ncbi:hypothetical protein KY290_018616 [Solanum tuberosum]|uniref:Pectinesterase inhibitor domain-containing protein n=1 Tax=Solanum tuberosum TaxID=4113 RepID=A0ABQ7VES2_SOLTU|nr:hypothetical protein KY289_017740 [Solanum tuberosum]KAH0762543.1 hypothetical protein KY290_018616 [Solanum tuberosum]
MSNKEKLLHDEKSSSRSKRKLRLIICLLALFIPIIVAVISASIILEQQTESNSLSFFPRNAITSIFILSLYASRIELENVATSIEKAISEVDMINPETVGVLRNCQGMIEFSLKKLNESEMSLGIDPDEKIFAINKVVWDLQLLIGEAMGQVQRCYDLLEKIPSTTIRDEIRRKSYEALQKMKNSRGILQNMDEILDLFYPRIGTTLVSFAWEYDYGRTTFSANESMFFN